MRISDGSSDGCSSDLEHQLGLGRVEDAVLLEHQQEAAAFDVELVQLGAEIHARGAVDAPDRGAGPLGGERVEPVEGLAGFRGAEAGLEQAALEGVAVADRSEERRVGKEWVST